MLNEANNSLSTIPRVDKTKTEIDENVTMANKEMFPVDGVRSSITSFETVHLRGMPIHAVTKEQTVTHLINCSIQNIGGWVVTPNLDILRRYTRSGSFRNLIATSTLNVADGMPLVWASRVKGQPVPERVNGTDLMIDVCEAAAAAGKSVFFLGGNLGSAEKRPTNSSVIFLAWMLLDVTALTSDLKRKSITFLKSQSTLLPPTRTSFSWALVHRSRMC